MSEPVIHLNLKGDNAWTDLLAGGSGTSSTTRREIIDAGTVLHMAVLPAGMSSGRTSVAIRIDLPETNRTVIVQTSLRALRAAMAAMAGINARYPEDVE